MACSSVKLAFGLFQVTNSSAKGNLRPAQLCFVNNRKKMSTYGINNATASIHLRLPKSLLAEMKVICAEEDCGGMSALVRRALRQYILMRHKQGSPPKNTAPKQMAEYGAATTTTSSNQVQQADEPYIPDFIKNAPGFDRDTWLKFRA